MKKVLILLLAVLMALAVTSVLYANEPETAAEPQMTEPAPAEPEENDPEEVSAEEIVPEPGKSTPKPEAEGERSDDAGSDDPEETPAVIIIDQTGENDPIDETADPIIPDQTDTPEITEEPEVPAAPSEAAGFVITVTITGKQASAVFDGEPHTAEGFDITDVSCTGEGDCSFSRGDLSFTGKAAVTRTEIGTTNMELTSEQFGSKKDADVRFIVIDGWMEITDPAQHSGGTDNTGNTTEIIDQSGSGDEENDNDSNNDVTVPEPTPESTPKPILIVNTEVAAEDPAVEPTEEMTETPEPETTPTPDPEIEETEEPTADPEIEETEEPTADPEIEETEEPTADPETEETETPANGGDDEYQTVISGEPTEGEGDPEPEEETDNTEEPGTVTVPAETVILADPDEASEAVITVDADTELVILSVENGWALVQLPDGTTGYIPMPEETDVADETGEELTDDELSEEEQGAEEPKAVVVPAETVIYTDPDEESEVVITVDEDTELTILSVENGWALVQLPDGTTGYIPMPEEEPAEGDDGSETVTAPKDTVVRLSPDGMSEVIITLDDDTEVVILGIEGDWVKVRLPDGTIGYIYYADLQTEETGPKTYTAKKVTIFTDRRMQMSEGDTITLTSRLEGFEDCTAIKYQWECNKGDGFKPVDGANGPTYSYGASVTTLSWSWRLIVLYK